ncbi:HFL119Cp [Eremothecium sinecaudum]|uniref:HFL119Cp n=1 Tax=Eremothecium sinecaudum TaxID=45286 RepID=A0A109UXR5_9SACH|nr:HFL119Cp [Eremothecium sinecaudum]AMD21737.1 HFL119Cp [Eremothecium sinecaudum]
MYFGSIILSIVYFAYAALAFVGSESRVSFKNPDLQNITLPKIDSRYVKLSSPIVVDELHEVVTVEFTIYNSKLPDQATVLVGCLEKSVETHISPEIKKASGSTIYTFKLEIDRLPGSLLHFSAIENIPLTVSLILAGEDKRSKNLFIELFDLKLNFTLDDRPRLPKRFVSLEDIQHTFNKAPNTAPRSYALLFCVVVSLCFVYILLTWLHVFGGSIEMSSGLDLFYKLAFVGCIGAAEHIFTKYYLGSDIFTTLTRILILGVVMPFFGSRVLRYLSSKESVENSNKN